MLAVDIDQAGCECFQQAQIHRHAADAANTSSGRIQLS